MQEVTVIGAGIAGLTAAITASQQGAQVRILEERAELGGRARTTALPYRANIGPHALYSDGAFWRWLEEGGLLPITASRGQTPLTYRYRGELIDKLPPLWESIATILSRQPNNNVSFGRWARTVVDGEAVELAAAFAFIPTYDPDAASLSAEFVWERIRRSGQQSVVHYVVGGWEALVSRLAEHAASLGVSIETKNKVVRLPSAPVIVATSAASAERLLSGSQLRSKRPRVGLFDIAIEGSDDIPASLLDIDERLYWGRYTAWDRSLAPPGVELLQIACGCRPNESFQMVQARIDSVLSAVTPDWRDRLHWSRRSLLSGATGAVDAPGQHWSTRPAHELGDGVFCAGDYVAAPGLLSEVSHGSGLLCGEAAASFSLRLFTRT